jgi:Fe-S cluster biogenesis protein NfuA
MKFIASAFVVSAFIASVSAAPLRLTRRAVDPTLVPDLGVKAGQNPTGTGDCDGIPNAQGVPIKIPCACPPDRQAFIDALNTNVAQGAVVNNPNVPFSFPTDDSKASKLARISASLVTLQNLRGPGVGCPAVSTTLQAQAAAIEAGNDVPSPDPTPAPAPEPSPAPAPAPAPSPAPGGLDPELVPDLGHQSGLNPTGTGDCDGIPNAQGVPIKIPCSCPPDRASFIAALSENVDKGVAVNNPSLSITFPTDDSKTSKLARIHASSVTLQNLRGPGVGCPIVSTTLQAQAAAIQAGP